MFTIALMMSSGYLYNNAKQQASDIKACQSVDVRWRYNSFNQVLCVPKRIYIGGTDLPLHQHAVAVGKTKSGDNNHQVIAPSNWRFISGDLNGDVKNGYPYGTDRNRLDNLGINRSTNWYMTGPNISNNGEMTWSQISGNRWTGDYLAINKLMPTIALHYIKRVSNPW